MTCTQILFSHPADFTPVCTTEIGRLALKYDELTDLGCKIATLSVDPVKSHTEWLEDVVAHCDNKIEIKFPIIGDADRAISTAFGMIDPGTSDAQGLPLTIRAVFIINPENKLMLSLNYPACVGRNMDEVVRCVKALILSYQKSIATPANWPYNHADVVLPDGTHTDEFQGSVFLLPTVSEAEANARYPGYHTCDVPSKKAYLRLVKASAVENATVTKAIEEPVEEEPVAAVVPPPVVDAPVEEPAAAAMEETAPPVADEPTMAEEPVAVVEKTVADEEPVVEETVVAEEAVEAKAEPAPLPPAIEMNIEL
jgi:peroxiredoxin 6